MGLWASLTQLEVKFETAKRKLSSGQFKRRNLKKMAKYFQLDISSGLVYVGKAQETKMYVHCYTRRRKIFLDRKSWGRIQKAVATMRRPDFSVTKFFVNTILFFFNLKEK
jgi:hypothetical protein